MAGTPSAGHGRVENRGDTEKGFRLPGAAIQAPLGCFPPIAERWHAQHPHADVLTRPSPRRRGREVSLSRRCHRSECQRRGQISQRHPQPCSGLIYTPETLPRSVKSPLIDGSATASHPAPSASSPGTRGQPRATRLPTAPSARRGIAPRSRPHPATATGMQG